MHCFGIFASALTVSCVLRVMHGTAEPCDQLRLGSEAARGKHQQRSSDEAAAKRKRSSSEAASKQQRSSSEVAANQQRSESEAAAKPHRSNSEAAAKPQRTSSEAEAKQQRSSSDVAAKQQRSSSQVEAKQQRSGSETASQQLCGSTCAGRAAITSAAVMLVCSTSIPCPRSSEWWGSPGCHKITIVSLKLDSYVPGACGLRPMMTRGPTFRTILRLSTEVRPKATVPHAGTRAPSRAMHGVNREVPI